MSEESKKEVQPETLVYRPKELEWSKDQYNGQEIWEANTGFGVDYFIYPDSDGTCTYQIGERHKGDATLDEAKAACQSHYNDLYAKGGVEVDNNETLRKERDYYKESYEDLQDHIREHADREGK